MFWAVAVALPRNHQSAGDIDDAEEEPLTALGIEQKNPLRAPLSSSRGRDCGDCGVLASDQEPELESLMS
jgi:hypothetical protein